jgi:hypothetical protein
VKLCGHLLLSSVSVKPSRVSNWHLILPASPEYEQLIRVCHAATGRVFAALAVSEAFHHCPVADGQRLFPDEVTVGKPPSVALMGADDVAGEINKRIASAVSGRDVHAMHGRHAPRLCQSVKFLNTELVMLEELVTVDAIRHVTFIAGILVKPRKRGRVNRKVNAFIRQGFHHFNAITVVDGVLIFDYLVNVCFLAHWFGCLEIK